MKFSKIILTILFALLFAAPVFSFVIEEEDVKIIEQENTTIGGRVFTLLTVTENKVLIKIDDEKRILNLFLAICYSFHCLLICPMNM